MKVHDDTLGGGRCIVMIDSWVYMYVKIYQILHFRKKYYKRKYWALYHCSLTMVDLILFKNIFCVHGRSILLQSLI